MVDYILNLIGIKDEFDLYTKEGQNNFIDLLGFMEENSVFNFKLDNLRRLELMWAEI